MGNKAISEAAATCCNKKGCGDVLQNRNILIIVVIFIVFCCCGGNFHAFGSPCGPYSKQGKCGSVGFGGVGGFSWILPIFLFALLGSNTFGSGNTNTNVINVDTDDNYDDEYC